MITPEQLRIAAEFALALHDQGVSFTAMQVATGNPAKMEAVAISVLGSLTAADYRGERLTVRTPLRQALSDARISNALDREGITYLEELTALHELEVSYVRNVGSVACAKIYTVLEAHGLQFLQSGASRKAALQRLYGDVRLAPLEIVFFNDLAIMNGLNESGIGSMEELLTRTAEELGQISVSRRRYPFDDEARESYSLSPRLIADIRSVLGGLGVHLAGE